MDLTEEYLPERVNRRLALAKLFVQLERKDERKWAKIFMSGRENIRAHFSTLAAELNYTEEHIEDNIILWREPEDNVAECMFCFIYDPVEFEPVYNIFKFIDKYKPVFTYGIIRQWKEGENLFDIFRYSKFSYMEHCNRVKYPTRKK